MTDQPTSEERIATILPDYRRWLYKTAWDLLPAGSPHADDLAQEGSIAMWRAFSTYDETKGALPSWLTTAARLRMRDVALSHGRWTGHEPMRGRAEPNTTSLDAVVEDGTDDQALVYDDVLDGVEVAYHHGEIAQALNALTDEQRQYVYLRFWAGLDPASRAPGEVALRAEFPVMAKRWLWENRNGARVRLATELAHLRAARPGPSREAGMQRAPGV